MALQIGELAVLFTADTKQLDSAMSSTKSSMDDLANRSNSMSSSVTQSLQAISDAGKFLSVSVAVPLALLGKKALESGAEIQKTGNLVRVAFGDMSKQAVDWSKKTGEAIGACEYDLQQMSSRLTIFAQNLGVPTKKAIEMGETLTQLSYDFEAFLPNLTAQEAFQKLNSGLAGMTRGLKDLGLRFSEAEIQARAVSMGLAKTTVEGGKVKVVVDQAAHAQAMYSLILEKSSEVLGTSERTAGNYEGQMRRLKTALNDVADNLGQALLPMATRVVDILKVLAQWAAKLAEIFGELPGPVQTLLAGLGSLAIILPPLAMSLKYVVDGLTQVKAAILLIPGAQAVLATLANPWVALGVAAVTAAVLIITNWDKVKQFFRDLASNIQNWCNQIQSSLWAAFASRFPGLADAMYVYLQKLKQAWNDLWQAIQSLTQAFTDVWNVAIKPAVKAWWDGYVTVLRVVWGIVKDLADAFMKVLEAMGLDKWTLLKIAIIAALTPLLLMLHALQAVAGALEIVAGAIQIILGAFQLSLPKIAEGVGKIAEGMKLLKQSLSFDTEKDLFKSLQQPLTGTPATPLKGGGATPHMNPAYLPWVREASQRYGVPESVIWAVMQQESGQQQYSRNGQVKRSGAGALGAMQLMPGTAAQLGVNPNDARQNILGGAHYLAQQYQRFGNWEQALAAYNAGPGRAANGSWRNIPETRNYVSNIMGMLNSGKGGAGSRGSSGSGTGPIQTAEQAVTLVEQLVKQNVDLHQAAVAIANRIAPNNRALRLRLLAAVEPSLAGMRAQVGITTPDTSSAISQIASTMLNVAYPSGTRAGGNTLLERLQAGTAGKKGDMHTAAQTIMQALGIAPEQQKEIRGQLEQLYPSLTRAMRTGATDWSGAVSQIESTIRGQLDKTAKGIGTITDRLASGELGKKGDMHTAAKVLLDALHVTPEEQQRIMSQLEKLFPAMKRAMAVGQQDWGGAVREISSTILSSLEDSTKRASDLMSNYGTRLAASLKATEPSVQAAAQQIVKHLTMDPAEQQRILAGMDKTMHEIVARMKADPNYKPEQAIRDLINAAVQGATASIKAVSQTLIQQLVATLEDPSKKHDLAAALDKLLASVVTDPEKRKALRDQILSSADWRKIVQDFQIGAASASSTIDRMYDLISKSDKDLVDAYLKAKKDIVDHASDNFKAMAADADAYAKAKKAMAEHAAQAAEETQKATEEALKFKQDAVDRIRNNWAQAGEQITKALRSIMGVNGENVEMGNALRSSIEQVARESVDRADLEAQFGTPLLNELASIVKQGDWGRVREVLAQRMPGEIQKAIESMNLEKAGDKFTETLRGMLGTNAAEASVASTLSSVFDQVVQEAVQTADLEGRFGAPFMSALTAAVRQGDWGQVRNLISTKMPEELQKAIEDANWEAAGTKLGELLAKNIPQGLRRTLQVGDILGQAVDDAVNSQMQHFELNRRFGSGVVDQVTQWLEQANGIQDPTQRQSALAAVASRVANQLAGTINTELNRALIDTLVKTPKKGWEAYGTTLYEQLAEGLKSGSVTLSQVLQDLWENTATNLEESKKMDEVIDQVGRGWWRKFAEKWKLNANSALSDLPLDAFRELTNRMEYVASDAGKRAAEAFGRQFDVAIGLIQSGGKVSGGLGGIVGLIGQLVGGSTGSILSAVGGGLSNGGGWGSVLGGIGMAVGGPVGGIIGSLLGGLFGGGGSKKDDSAAKEEEQKKYELGQNMVKAIMRGMQDAYPSYKWVTSDIFMTAQSAIYKAMGIDPKKEAEALKKNRDTGEKIITSLIQGLQSKYPQLADLSNKIRDMVTGEMKLGWKDNNDLGRRLTSDTTLNKLLDAVIGAVPGLGRNKTAVQNMLSTQLLGAFNQWSGIPVDPQAMPYVGQAIIDGIIEGLKKADPRLQFAINEITDAITQTMKEALAISSPSRVFMGIGENITLGLVHGLRNGRKAVRDTVLGIAELLATGAQSGQEARAQQASFLSAVSQGQPVTVSVELDGRVIAKRTLELQPGLLRMKGVMN